VLDLFAGSGALGFEALSRGAARAVFVEDGRSAIQVIEKNAAELGVTDRITLISEPLPRAWKRLEALGPFEVVMADPPYDKGWERKLLDEAPWGPLLAEDGLFVLEWGLRKSQVEGGMLPEQTVHLVKVREKNYGDSVLTTYRKGA
jgi:16S rRNA (guanine966-N2)-methyltransferase